MADTKKPWAEGPYELISSSKTGAKKGVKQTGATAVASEMILVHNAFIRGMNAIYRQVVNVATKGTAKDKLDFANFAYRWTLGVHSHHGLEEKVIFPRIAEDTGVQNIMATNIEEHEAFEAGLDGFEKYMVEVKDGKAELDGEKTKKMIDEVMPILHKHLSNEIDTLLSLEQYADKCDVEKICREAVDAALATAMKDPTYRTELLPMIFITHDKGFEDDVWDNFPPIGWFPMLIIRWLYIRSHQDWWRFAPCNSYCVPQELPFA